MRGVAMGLGLVAACGAAVPALAQKTATYEARFEPKFGGISDQESIAVLNFNGKDGDIFASTLAGVLQSAQLDGRSLFVVKTLDSMNYRSGTDISRAEVAQAIRQGEKLGVKIVFTGTVSAASITTTNFNREETVCAESSGFLKCKRQTTRKIPCSKVVGQYTVTPRAMRVSNGQVVYSQTASAQGEYTICEGQLQSNASLGDVFGGLFGGKKKDGEMKPEISSPDGLLGALRAEAAEKIRLDIAPYNRSVTVTFMDKVGKFSKAENEQFAGALAFAGAGRLDRTCALFETLYAQPHNQNNISVLYNMGACQEVLLPEEPGAALAYYAKADQLLTKPNKLISDAFLRTKAAVGRDRSLAP
ncbi:hypothetical protein [Sphingopyxis sp. HIX]|nr:hypothetical protein [Sphingopyxis sp. HIX]